MKLYHIAAISENHVIAKGGIIPWNLKEDLKRFAEITKGHPIIMGSTTFDSIGRALPGRLNVVLSSKDLEHTPAKDVVYCKSFEEALDVCHKHHDVYVIGGGKVYAETLPIVDEIRMTIVHQEVEVDDTCVFYPEIDDAVWAMSFVETYETHTYVDYVRRDPSRM